MKQLLFVLPVLLTVNAQLPCSIVDLQTEHLVNPLGIDAVHPRLSWRIEDGRKGARQTASQIFVDRDSLSVLHGQSKDWQSQKMQTSSQLITYKGRPLQPFTKYYWMVKVWDKDGRASMSGIASFETGMMELRNWKGSWISDTRDIHLKPAAYFRRTFQVSKNIIAARAYIAAAGLYELYIDGQRIGDHQLDPMYTRFDRRNLYVTYDVTSQLQRGDNAMGILLGNGWYNLQSTAVWYFDKAPWRARPAFCMDLRITYSDGTVQTISSDKDWKASLSPVVFNSIYTGEHYNANKEMAHWNETSYNDSAWQKVMYVSAPSNNIVAQALDPIRDKERIPAVSVKKYNDTDYVFDLGRNIAGVSELTIDGSAGTVIKLKHGELLDSFGHVSQRGIDQHYRPTDDSDPFQTDIYTLNGKEKTFRPRFNYKGFQYVEVTSSRPIALNKENLTGIFMHSDVPVAGNMYCANELINKIWQATNSSYLSNLFGYPTDCPQREKNGWTGDAHIAVETGLFNFDAITVYEKWLADMRDAQQPNGVLPSIVPSNDWGYSGRHNGPDWVSAIAIIPWELYQFYGDTKPLADNYDAIKRYVDMINERYPSGLCNWGLGDWVPIDEAVFPPREFTSTIYYYTDVVILAKAAKLLGKTQEAVQYQALAKKIRDVFNQKYLNAITGNYDRGFQTELSMALFWELVPEELKTKTAALLAQRVIADGKLNIGLLGSKTILNALSDNGYADLAYQLASSDRYPSWGYWIANGATTLPEGWEVGPNTDFSLNHIMFGEISAWFYKALGGIRVDPEHPGFQNILLEPHFVQGLDSFSCYHDGPYGRIESRWKHVNGEIEYKIVIPANSTATLRLNNKVILLRAGSYTYAIKLQ